MRKNVEDVRLKLREALEIVKEHPGTTEAEVSVLLACGFTPLHLETFLQARLCRRFPDRGVRIGTGLFGDLQGTLRGADANAWDGIAVVLEWDDLDPRLGLRRLGGWPPDGLADILAGVGRALETLEAHLEKKVGRCPVILLPPSLPLPPVSYAPTWQESTFEAELRELVAAFIKRISALPSLRVGSLERLGHRSSPTERIDVKRALHEGFPYQLGHADEVARLVTTMLFPPARKKGLITDLDNTLWRGILGEVGPEGIAWQLEDGAQHHGLYQQLLNSLAEAGTFVAVASKNEPDLVDQVFANGDLLLSEESVFPIEAHWEPKSKSISRILEVWNIGPESVVFVDDSSHELAEVGGHYPEITGLRFPADDPEEAVEVLYQLRDLFGADALTEEDRIRVASVRQAEEIRSIREEGSEDRLDRFLREIEGAVTVEDVESDDERPYTLLNKTNQFNLNGVRLSEAEWADLLGSASHFLWVVSYRDKFGPLGKIAVVVGRRESDTLTLDHWVMSCRAFSRRIEHLCMRLLFRTFKVPEIVLRFRGTERNGPLRKFLVDVSGRELHGNDEGFESVPVTRESFHARCPELHHELEIEVSERVPVGEVRG